MGSDLFRRASDYAAADRDGGALHRQVWGSVPWMLDVYVGSEGDGDQRFRAIADWCFERWGLEAFPFGDTPRPGCWRSGNAVVFGWQWFGFDTEARMRAFQTRWGGTDQQHDHKGRPPPPPNTPSTLGA